MKTFLNLFILIFFSISIYGQKDSTNIYIIRDTKSMGALTNFEIFVDGELICELKNHNYIIANLSPGSHKFSVQMTGKKAKSNVDHFELIIENNKTYYLQVETPGSVMGSTSFLEITKNSADKIIPRLTKQEDCL